MAKIGTVQEVAINTLTPYKNNAKQHTRAQVEKIAESIKEFGFLSPVLIDRAGNIIAGHGRIMAAQALGLVKVPAEVLTSTRAGRWSKYGLDIRITPAELQRINGLDAQKEQGKEIFGSGFITSDRVAADTAAADKYCDETEINEIKEQREQLHHVWELSERERGIVDRLNAAGGAQNGR